MKLGIFGNNYQADHLNDLKRFLALLDEEGIEVCVHRDFAGYLNENGIPVPDDRTVDDLPADVDIVASIGGDGTFLHSADWVGSREVPIMGINTGHLGYLTGYSFNDSDIILRSLRGDYELSSRMTLRVESPYLPKEFSPIALNEISVSKGDTTSMVEIKALIDGKFLADYLSDGLVAATPTGSTAYSLSCGGPIMQPTLDSMIITPIAPHSLTLRPLVVDADSELTFEISSRGDECHIGVDGRTFVVPGSGSSLRIARGDYRVLVMQPPATDFARVLRNKLGWGRIK